MPSESVRKIVSSSPYWPVVRHPVLRRILPGVGLSYIGDGMSTVAVTWLALELAPEGSRGTWVAVAAVAYILPGALGGILFGRLLSARSGAQLAGWDAILRATALGLIPVMYVLDALSMGLYIALLAASSLLHAWGTAGRYTLLTEVLQERHHLAGNAVITIFSEFATVVGPPVAALLIAWGGAATVIAVDAATFALLALTYRLAAPRTAASDTPRSQASRSAGFRAILGDRRLSGLLALTFGYFLLFGPVLIALPVLVSEELGGSAAMLAWYYTAFGIGSVIGGLITGYLRNWSLWPTTIGIVIGFGAALLPMGLGAPTAVVLVSFGLAGLIWAPYAATSTVLFQRAATPQQLPQVLAARGTVMIVSVPLGNMIGGPLSTAIGARQTLLASAIATVLLGLAAAVVVLLRRGRAAAA
ncbi:MFS transporter [Streptomyces sp. NPDC060048]|uniref:MFS transporter n=1 Tax=unclassified Streptomyces TaxID=2593676 RepID=UPI0036B61D83